MLSISQFRPAILGLVCAGLPAVFGQAEVKLNELLAKNDSYLLWDGSNTDYVELYNTSAQPVDLGNASLTDDPTAPRKWVFPAGASIPANGYLVVAFDDAAPASVSNTTPLNAGFALGAGGGGIWFYPRGGGAVLDSVTYGFQAGDFSIGRIPNGTGAWVLNSPTALASNVSQQTGSAAGIRINEWMADPTNGDDWFELYNPASQPVALGGYFLTDDPTDPTLSPIPPLSFIGIEQSAFLQIWADDNAAAGANHVAFALGRGGDTIVLYGPTAQVIDTVTFGAQTENISQGRMPDGSNTIIAMPPGGSPEDSNYLLFPGLIVTEVLHHSDPPFEDAVEFYNQTDSPINIGGWYLSNSRNELKKYRVPDGTVVPARNYKVFYESEYGTAPEPAGFTLSASRGDQIFLSEVDGSGNLTGRRVEEEFEPAPNNVSFGRHETSVTGDYKFVAMRRPTFGVENPDTVEEFRTGTGAPNSGPRVGPIVINEIMYHPVSPDGGVTDNVLDEYIELRNITPFEVPLYDPNYPTNVWRLRDAVSFRFPEGSSIPPYGYALVVSFDPAQNATQLAVFRSKFAVPEGVMIFGPFSGQLSNGGEGVELYRPDTPQMPPSSDAGQVPYVRVDKVNYTDEAPWPATPDGTGFALRKKDGAAFGNDPIHWDGANPTAGKGNYPELEDRDQDGLPNAWETAASLNSDDPADATADTDGDGLSNLFEYALGTAANDAQSALLVQADLASGTAPQISFSATAGRAYVVEARNSLAPGSSWEPVAYIDPQTASGNVEISDPEGLLDHRFYRVRLALE